MHDYFCAASVQGPFFVIDMTLVSTATVRHEVLCKSCTAPHTAPHLCIRCCFRSSTYTEATGSQSALCMGSVTPCFVLIASLALQGALILAVSRYVSKIEARRFMPVIASALIAGDGIWTVVSAILALAGAVSPVCMTFTHGDQATVSNLDSPIN